MNHLISLFIGLLFLSPFCLAADSEVERLEEAIEVENFIVNFSPSGQNLGRVRAALCAECPLETLTFDQNTLLVIDGKLHPIDELKLKAEWSGVLYVTNLAPNKIIKFKIY